MTTTWYNFNKMTSNTSPSPFVASASSEYNHEYEAWRSFNGARHPYQQWVTNKNDTEGWNQIYVKDPVLVNVIKMCSGTDGTHASGAGIMPQWLEILGSNDGVSFESLGVFTTPLWIKNQEREFVFNNKKLFSYFRISVKNAGATGWGVGFDEVYFGFNPDYLKPENKTLILSNGEYKKVTPAIPYSPQVLGAKVGLVPNMTSYTAPSGLVFASSFSVSRREPWRAFNGSNADTTYTWSTANYKAEGEFIGYIFPSPQKIFSYAIFPVNAGNNLAYGWDFQISNDTTNGTNGTWLTIDVQRNQGQIIQALNHYDLSTVVEAKAFRIVTRPTIGSGNLISSWVKQIQTYKRDIISPEIQDEPMKITTVSTTLPNPTQFLEHGMDNLSPLLDRKVTTLEPMPMTNKSEILGVSDIGKVFSKTLDLIKYFDIRSIRTEVKKE